MSVTDDVRAALARLDGAAGLGAVVARNDAAALTTAAELDREAVRRPWAGATVTVKDWIDVADLPCEGASAVRTGRVPTRDASAVARLRAAGAVVVAKTQPGAEHPVHGVCLHPLDEARTPGGSSTGEAALIAAGASRIGLGSDSGGSIRLPAAWCGVAGHKPSFGLVPATGHFPRIGARHDGRTVIGPLGARVADLAAVLAVIAGPDGLDPDCVPAALPHVRTVRPAGLRIAVVDDPACMPGTSTRAAVAAAVAALEHVGSRIAGVPFPVGLDEALDVTQRYWGRRSRTGGQADDQLADWDRYRRRLTRETGTVDVVIGPTVADVAPPRRPLTGEDYVFTLPWSLTGWPAASIPAGTDPTTGLPVAVQVAAPVWHDHVVLAVASWLETAFAPS